MSNNWVNWTVYIVLRLAVFLVPLGLMLWLNVPQYLAVIFSALIGVALSILLLSKWRGAASTSIYERKARKGTVKQDQATTLGEEEDEAVDAAFGSAGYVTPDAARDRAGSERKGEGKGEAE